MRVKVLVYTLCGALAGFAGVVAISRLAAADPTSGVMMELDAIAAVVIGGASLAGGRGHILGSIAGVVTMAVLHNAMTLLDINPDWQDTVVGVVILGAVLANRRGAPESRQGRGFVHGDSGSAASASGTLDRSRPAAKSRAPSKKSRLFSVFGVRAAGAFSALPRHRAPPMPR